MDQYLVLDYADLDSQASFLGIPYQELERQLIQAISLEAHCVYFKRYTSFHWIMISNKLPVDWVMALVLA